MRLKNNFALPSGAFPFLDQQQGKTAFAASKDRFGAFGAASTSTRPASSRRSSGSVTALQTRPSAKNARCLAAHLPQEILLKIFAYLMPSVSADDPFSTSQPGPVSSMSDLPMLPTAAGDGARSNRSSSDSVNNDRMNVDNEDENAFRNQGLPLSVVSPCRAEDKQAVAHSYYHNVHRCLFVCASWYQAAVYYIYSEPVLETIYDLIRFIDSLEYVARCVKQLDEPTNIDFDALQLQQQAEEQLGQSQRSHSAEELDARHHTSNSAIVTTNTASSSSSLYASLLSSVNTSQQSIKMTSETRKGNHARDYIGMSGPSHIRILRFEHTNLITAKCGAYRIPVKGSEPSPSVFINDEHIRRIASAFEVLQPAVARLYLNNCASLTDVAVIHLTTTTSTSLRTLNLTNCRLIRDVTVRTVARLCNRLEELVLRGCGKVGDVSIRDVSISLGTQLRVLDISGCMRINDPGLDFLAKWSGDYSQQNKRLRERPIHARSPPGSPRASSPTPDSPSHSNQPLVLPNQPPRSDNLVGGKLSVLCLPGIRRQSRGGLTSFLQEMALVHPRLREVEFSIPPPPSTSTKSIFSGSAMLFPYLSQLTSLTIRDCEYLDDANLMPISQCCNLLERLALFNVVHMTDASFVPILQECGQLRQLTVRGGRLLTDRSTSHLLTAECASKLTRLDMTDCYELADETLFMLSSTLPECQTEITNTHGSGTITVVTKAAPIFKSLEHIALENCRRVTFRSVIAITKALVHPVGSLVSLHISGAYEGVTHRALVHYRDGRNPPVTREIHLATFNERGLVRDEFEVGAIGSGGASMLWNIMPLNQPLRQTFAWHCRLVRTALFAMVNEYSWIPIEPRKYGV